VYFQIVYASVRRAHAKGLWRRKIMERQTEAKATFPPSYGGSIDGGKARGLPRWEARGALAMGSSRGFASAVPAPRRAGITLTEDDRAASRHADPRPSTGGLKTSWGETAAGRLS